MTDREGNGGEDDWKGRGESERVTLPSQIPGQCKEPSPTLARSGAGRSAGHRRGGDPPRHRRGAPPQIAPLQEGRCLGC